MRKALALALLAGLGSSAAADPIGRPFDLMDLAGGSARAGLEVDYSNVTATGLNGSYDVFELDGVGQFPVSPTLDITARLPFASGEDDAILGDFELGVLAKLHDGVTSSGGRLKLGLEGSLFLPTSSKPSLNNLKNYLGAGFSRTLLYPRWAGRVLTVRGDLGLRFETGKAFFEGAAGLDMGNETEDRGSRSDNTHFYLNVGGGGGAEVAHNFAVLGEFTYLTELDDHNFDGAAIAISAGLRYRAARKLVLGAAILKSLDLPNPFESFGLRFDLIGYF